jgi:flavin-dependent dehydrogenase
VLFVGDAAGTLDPFTGEGTSNALRGGELATPFVLAALERGGLDDELSAGWTECWHRAFAPVTRRARALGRVLERPRIAGLAVRLLSGPARAFAPRLVAGTRTGVVA